jgi:hypothetical protein
MGVIPQVHFAHLHLLGCIQASFEGAEILRQRAQSVAGIGFGNGVSIARSSHAEPLASDKTVGRAHREGQRLPLLP